MQTILLTEDLRSFMIEFKRLKLLCIMLLVACLTGFASDIYTPSFSKMSQDFSAPIYRIQSSMIFFMLGVSISQLIYGPLSEIIGRRIPLTIGLLIMLIGNITCLYASDIDRLLIGRFIQGTGAGACACLWRSIFRDSFNSIEISKYGGYLGIIMVFIVAASPALGGYLESWCGWRASFLAITIYSLLTLLLVWFLLQETSTSHHKDRLNIYFFATAFGQLLSSPVFMGYAFCTFLTYGAFFSWFILGSVLLIDNVGVTAPTFGLINLFLGGTSMAMAGFFNGKMVTRLGTTSMLRLGWGLMFLSGLMLTLSSYLYGHTLIPIMVSIFVFLFGTTLIWPNTFAGAFAPFGTIAGCAGSLYSFIQLSGGVAVGWFSSFLSTENSYSLSIVFIFSSISAWTIFERLVMKNIKLNNMN